MVFVDTVGLLLFGIVFLTGILLALLVDGSFWGRHLEKAVSRNRTLKQKVHRTERDLAAAVSERRQLSNDLNSTTARLQNLQTESHRLRQSLEHSNAELADVRERMEALRDENHHLCERIKVADVEMTHLKANLVDAQEAAQQLQQFQLDNQALSLKLGFAEERLAEMQAEATQLRQELLKSDSLQAKLAATEADMALVLQNLAGSEDHIISLQAHLEDLQQQLSLMGKNQLEIIRGIGPAYAQHLNEAGIITLADLAETDPERIPQIIKLKPWQNVDPANWVADARQMVGSPST